MTGEVALSIVVAAHHGGHALERCLAAVERELAGDAEATEVLVVRPGEPGPAAASDARQAPAGLRYPRGPAGAGVPELRAAGIAAARGAVVALLEDHLQPAPGWLEALRRAHAEMPDRLAIGGAVDPAPGDRRIDRAAYFCEYGWHMSPLQHGETPLLTGANVSYKRRALELFGDLLPAWETVWHERLRECGHSLHAEPAMIVVHERRFEPLAFLRERLRYGRDYAAERSRGMGVAERVARALAAPALPLVLLTRLGISVFRKGRNRGSFVAALPWALAFFGAWSLGETAGYARGATRKGP